MSRRALVRLAVALYPAWWRRRYRDEVAAVAEQEPPTFRAWLDLLRGAMDAWAHQRPPQPMFARFADDARAVVVLAQKEARALHHNYVGTEHVLLGLLAQEGDAAAALTVLGVSAERVRTRLNAFLERGTATPTPHCHHQPPCTVLPKWSMRVTPRAKRGFDLSGRAAARLGHREIGAIHLLLGLLDEAEGVGAVVLAEFAHSEAVRAELFRRINR